MADIDLDAALSDLGLDEATASELKYKLEIADFIRKKLQKCSLSISELAARCSLAVEDLEDFLDGDFVNTLSETEIKNVYETIQKHWVCWSKATLKSSK